MDHRHSLCLFGNGLSAKLLSQILGVSPFGNPTQHPRHACMGNHSGTYDSVDPGVLEGTRDTVGGSGSRTPVYFADCQSSHRVSANVFIRFLPANAATRHSVFRFIHSLPKLVCIP